MAHHPILTDDELAMLRDLGSNQDTHVLSGHLDAPMLGLLQKAEHLVLEARFAGHQLRFPLSFTQGEDGFVEPRLSAPVIRELGFAQPRAWRLTQKAKLCSELGLFQVLSLSLNGLIVENLPTDMVADIPPSTVSSASSKRSLFHCRVDWSGASRSLPTMPPGR